MENMMLINLSYPKGIPEGTERTFMKKKLLTLSLVACMLLSLCSCKAKENSQIRVASLKGPTSIGLVKLMDQAENGQAKGNYSFEIATSADEILPRMISGDLDIALIPANVSSILYKKSNESISVIDINTLGVLYAVSGDDSILSVSDLAGKKVLITGKGTTPDYVLSYLLSKAGLNNTDLTIEYKSEATEVAALLKEDPSAVGILPQPFVTAATSQNENLKVVLDLTAQWDKYSDDGSQLVTGVTVVRNDFLKDHKKEVETFIKEHHESADFVNKNLDDAAKLVVKTAIIEKAPIAKKAIPYCNITCISGQEMKNTLKGYLEVLYSLDPASVGGSLPSDNFYY